MRHCRKQIGVAFHLAAPALLHRLQQFLCHLRMLCALLPGHTLQHGMEGTHLSGVARAVRQHLPIVERILLQIEDEQGHARFFQHHIPYRCHLAPDAMPRLLAQRRVQRYADAGRNDAGNRLRQDIHGLILCFSLGHRPSLPFSAKIAVLSHGTDLILPPAPGSLTARRCTG